MRYHELSWVAEIDDEERLQMLYVLFKPTSRLGNNPNDPFEQFRSSHLRCACSCRPESISIVSVLMPR